MSVPDSEPFLEHATRALREFSERAPAPARATRADILGSIRAAHSVGHPKVFALAACFVLFGASTAWGARPGMPLHRAYRAVVENLERLRPHALPRPYRSPTPNAAKPAVLVESPAASVTTVAIIVAPTPSPAAPPIRTTAPRPDDLYRVAHRLHFVEVDMQGALAAWNRYLAYAPNAPFAPEARYNRAIALVRLGRRAEGVEALRPFADGVHGDYRREEARKLMRALTP